MTAAEIAAEINKNLDHLAEAADEIVATIADMRAYLSGSRHSTMADIANEYIARMRDDSIGGSA